MKSLHQKLITAIDELAPHYMDGEPWDFVQLNALANDILELLITHNNEEAIDLLGSWIEEDSESPTKSLTKTLRSLNENPLTITGLDCEDCDPTTAYFPKCPLCNKPRHS